MKRAIRWYDTITINAYWFALTTRSQVLTPLVIPLLVQRFVGGPIADRTSYVLLFGVYGILFLLSALAVRGIEEQRPVLVPAADPAQVG